MPVTALVGAAGAIDLTSKFKGVEGNDIDVRFAYGGALAAERVPIGLDDHAACSTTSWRAAPAPWTSRKPSSTLATKSTSTSPPASPTAPRWRA